MKPRALDLFCGEGGASMGLHRAGFDVVGVDIKPQPRYPFTFIQADALNPPFRLEDFDMVWTSPPCQAYTAGNEAARRAGKVNHPDLIPQTRALLAGHPVTVIENVPGAPLRVDVALDGTMFPDLRVIRRRHFECSFPVPLLLGFDAQDHVGRYGWSTVTRSGSLCSNTRKARIRWGGRINDTKAEKEQAMGIDWMTTRGLGNAIPPAYSEFIGRAALAYLGRAAA